MSLTRWFEYGVKLGACHCLATPTLFTACDGNRHFPFPAPTLGLCYGRKFSTAPKHARNFLLAFTSNHVMSTPRSGRGTKDAVYTNTSNTSTREKNTVDSGAKYIIGLVEYQCLRIRGKLQKYKLRPQTSLWGVGRGDYT